MATITLTSEEQTINLVTEGSVSLSASNGKSAYQSYLSTTSDDPVLTEAEWSEGGGGGGGDYLPLAGGIMDNGAEIAFDNASKIRQTPGSNGIDQVCSIDYVHRWKEGSLYIMDQSGGIRSVQYGLSFTPDSTFDITQGYLVGSRFIKDDGTVFECTDNTDGAAVWVDVTPLSSVEVTSATATDITGLLKGDGSAVSAATAGTDYVATDDARLTDARTPTSHVHGGISNAGAIGSTSGLPIKTGASGVLEVGAFGTSAGQFAQGNDSRFHDRSHAITSTSDHTAGNWKVFHSNNTGQLVELALGANGTYLKSNGASAAPTFDTPAGGGGSSITGTGIAYVRSGGVDLEGTIGDPSKPYLTAQAAWDDGARNLEFGGGSYTVSHYTTSDGTGQETVRVRGIGKDSTSLTINWSGTPATEESPGGKMPVKPILISDQSVSLTINLSGGDAHSGDNNGGAAPTFEFWHCYIASFYTVGGNGSGSGSSGSTNGGITRWCETQSAFPASPSVDYYATLEAGFLKGGLIASNVTYGGSDVDAALTSLASRAVTEHYMRTTDFTDSSGTVSDVTGLSCYVAENEKVLIEIVGFRAGGAAGSGLKIQFTGPDSPTDVKYTLEHWNAVNTGRTVAAATSFNTILTQADGSMDYLPIRAILTLINGPNPDTVRFRAASENSGTSITLLKGLTMRVHRIP